MKGTPGSTPVVEPVPLFVGDEVAPDGGRTVATIAVLQVSTYGRIVFRPLNERAKLLAAIAGTQTLTHQALRKAKEMGFEVEVQVSRTSF